MTVLTARGIALPCVQRQTVLFLFFGEILLFGKSNADDRAITSDNPTTSFYTILKFSYHTTAEKLGEVLPIVTDT